MTSDLKYNYKSNRALMKLVHKAQNILVKYKAVPIKKSHNDQLRIKIAACKAHTINSLRALSENLLQTPVVLYYELIFCIGKN